MLSPSSDEFQKFVSAEYVRWGAVLKQAKIEDFGIINSSLKDDQMSD